MKINGGLFENKDVKVLANIIQNVMEEHRKHFDESIKSITTQVDLKINELKIEVSNLKEEIKEVKGNRARVNLALFTAVISFLFSLFLLLVSNRI